jgi:hypothetical protein
MRTARRQDALWAACRILRATSLTCSRQPFADGAPASSRRAADRKPQLSDPPRMRAGTGKRPMPHCKDQAIEITGPRSLFGRSITGIHGLIGRLSAPSQPCLRAFPTPHATLRGGLMWQLSPALRNANAPRPPVRPHDRAASITTKSPRRGGSGGLSGHCLKGASDVRPPRRSRGAPEGWRAASGPR